jgi:hypothetical protein
MKVLAPLKLLLAHLLKHVLVLKHHDVSELVIAIKDIVRVHVLDWNTFVVVNCQLHSSLVKYGRDYRRLIGIRRFFCFVSIIHGGVPLKS